MRLCGAYCHWARWRQHESFFPMCCGLDVRVVSVVRVFNTGIELPFSNGAFRRPCRKPSLPSQPSPSRGCQASANVATAIPESEPGALDLHDATHSIPLPASDPPVTESSSLPAGSTRHSRVSRILGRFGVFDCLARLPRGSEAGRGAISFGIVGVRFECVDIRVRFPLLSHPTRRWEYRIRRYATGPARCRSHR
jgi:hypothetical protein